MNGPSIGLRRDVMRRQVWVGALVVVAMIALAIGTDFVGWLGVLLVGGQAFQYLILTPTHVWMAPTDDGVQFTSRFGMIPFTVRWDDVLRVERRRYGFRKIDVLSARSPNPYRVPPVRVPIGAFDEHWREHLGVNLPADAGTLEPPGRRWR